MDGRFIWVKLAASGVISAGIAAFGAQYRFVVVLIILMITDTALGWLKALKKRDFKLRVATWGFAGKMVELMLVYILGRLDWAFEIDGLLANIGVFYYGIVELASIVENIHEGGLAALPEGMVTLVRNLKYHAGKIVTDKIVKAINTAVGIPPDAIENQKGEAEHGTDEKNIAQ